MIYARSLALGVRQPHGIWMRCWVAVCAVIALASCRAADRTITHGVESRQEWRRRLAEVIPLGTPAESARVVLERNGFACRPAAEGPSAVWCDKWSGGRWAIVRRRWIASVTIDNGKVVATRANTGLVGP